MAEKKEKKPYEIAYTNLKKESKIVNNSLLTLKTHQQSIMADAYKKHIFDETGEADPDRLDSSKEHGKKYQLAIHDDIVGGMDKVLNDYYHSNVKNMPKVRAERLRSRMMGASSAQLTTHIETLGKNFNPDTYQKVVVDDLLQHMAQIGIANTYENIDTKDVAELLKLAKLDDKFNPKMIELMKNPTYKPAIGQLLYHAHMNKGNVDHKVYQDLGLSPFLKNED